MRIFGGRCFFERLAIGLFKRGLAAVIVHDKFHVAKMLNEAVDSIRRKEHNLPWKTNLIPGLKVPRKMTKSDPESVSKRARAACTHPKWMFCRRSVQA
jgi:Transposase